jgi:hypothetical protein
MVVGACAGAGASVGSEAGVDVHVEEGRVTGSGSGPVTKYAQPG